jgi:hypothetical protein
MPKSNSRKHSARAAPARCAGRPLHGGLVVPWITGWADGRPYLGVNFGIRRRQAITHRLCQIDGQPLGRRIGLLVRPADVEAGWVDEPGMHPECLDYSILACPMLTGALDTYRGRPPAGIAGLLAPDSPRHGHAADAYDAWFISPSGYQISYADDGTVRGLSLDVPVLMKRPVRAAARPRLSMQDEAALRFLVDLALGPDPTG